jgi:hypothetical protein
MKDALESLGTQFHATINALDWPTYLAQLRKTPSPFPMFYLGWAPDYADPDDYCNPFLLTGGVFTYRTGYSNATIHDLVMQASSELNATLRSEMYSEITWLTHNDTPYLWLYQLNNFHVERSWIQGYYFNPMHNGLCYVSLSKLAVNTPPRAYFTAMPTSGDVTTAFLFDAAGSSDLEEQNTTLEVRWDWESDGTWDTSWTTLKTEWSTFVTAGTYTVMLEVRDSGGLTNTTTVDVLVTELIPEFGTIIVPVLALAAAILMTRRIRSSRA